MKLIINLITNFSTGHAEYLKIQNNKKDKGLKQQKKDDKLSAQQSTGFWAKINLRVCFLYLELKQSSHVQIYEID